MDRRDVGGGNGWCCDWLNKLRGDNGGVNVGGKWDVLEFETQSWVVGVEDDCVWGRGCVWWAELVEMVKGESGGELVGVGCEWEELGEIVAGESGGELLGVKSGGDGSGCQLDKLREVGMECEGTVVYNGGMCGVKLGSGDWGELEGMMDGQ